MLKPIFTITPGINQNIAEIEKIKTTIERSNIIPEVEIELRLRASVEAIFSSTSIEGNPLNKLQVQKVLKGQPVRASDYAIKEVINYKLALDWVEKRLRQKKEINEKDIPALHKIVMERLLPKEKVGNWRPGPVYIVEEKKGKEIVRYTGPEAKKIPGLISDLLKWLSLSEKSDLHTILVAGLLHYFFVSIHPFSDGNGRTTRLLTMLYLRQKKYGFKGTLALDSYYLQNQQNYYKALSLGSTYSRRLINDATPFLDFFTKGFLTSIQELYDVALLGKINRDNASPIKLNRDELAILDYVKLLGSITAKEVADNLELSSRTAQRRLSELVKKGFLQQEYKGKATQYLPK
jgi:Fic family protein